MLKFYLTLVFCLFSSFHTAAQDFISVFEDIPLIDGLQALPDQEISFGNEEVRYIETVLFSPKDHLDFNKVVNFYNESLNQLGWTVVTQKDNSLTFSRESDILIISKISNSPLKIRFILTSSN